VADTGYIKTMAHATTQTRSPKMTKLTLKERAAHWYARQCEKNEAALAADLAEIRRLMHDINVQIPGTPEYNAEREREARMRTALCEAARDTYPLRVLLNALTRELRTSKGATK